MNIVNGDGARERAAFLALASCYGFLDEAGEVMPDLIRAAVAADEALADLPLPSKKNDRLVEFRSALKRAVWISWEFKGHDVNRIAADRASDYDVDIESAEVMVKDDLAALDRLYFDLMEAEVTFHPHGGVGRTPDENFANAVKILCDFLVGCGKTIECSFSYRACGRTKKRKDGGLSDLKDIDEPISDSARFVCDVVECFLARKRKFRCGDFTVSGNDSDDVYVLRKKISSKMRLYIAHLPDAVKLQMVEVRKKRKAEEILAAKLKRKVEREAEKERQKADRAKDAARSKRLNIVPG